MEEVKKRTFLPTCPATRALVAGLHATTPAAARSASWTCPARRRRCHLFARSELGGRQSTWSASRRHPAECNTATRARRQISTRRALIDRAGEFMVLPVHLRLGRRIGHGNNGCGTSLVIKTTFSRRENDVFTRKHSLKSTFKR